MDYKYVKTINDSYGIDIYNMKLFERHFGTEIYTTDIGGARLFIKIYPAFLNGAENEGNISNFLIENGIRTPRFLQTANGEHYVKNDNVIITVQEFVEGETFEVNTAPDWFMDEFAKLLAKINLALSGYGGKLPVRFDAGFFAIEVAAGKKDQLAAEFDMLSEKAEEGLKTRYREQIKHLARIGEFYIDTSRLTYVPSHGDYHIGQAIVKGKDITVVDWASACRLPVCLDLITSFVFSSFKAKYGVIDATSLKRYIESYTTHSALSDYDIAAMPYVFYFWHTMCNYSPQEEIAESYMPIANLIRNTQNWLYDNADKLSKQLSN